MRGSGSWKWLTNADHGASVLSLVSEHVTRVLQPIAKHLRYLYDHDLVFDSASGALDRFSHLSVVYPCDWILCVMFGESFFQVPEPWAPALLLLYQRALTRAALFVRWVE